MSNNFENFKHPYTSDNSMVDLRSYALKALDYINYLAAEAGAEDDPFVQKAHLVVKSFSLNRSLVNTWITFVEQRLKGRIEDRRRGKNGLPSEVLKNGVINIGKALSAGEDVSLKIENFSGNMTLYGGYGMGKTNLTLNIIQQLISQGIHVDIFDLAADFRDLLLVSGCENGLVLNHGSDLFNPLEPIGSPEDHLQFLWEIVQQNFGIRDETKEMLFNFSCELYEDFGISRGAVPPSLNDLKEFLRAKARVSATTVADKRKIHTALRTIDYILSSFKGMANCRKGYSLDLLDKFSFVSYEIGDLSEDKRSWYMKLKARQYQHKGMSGKERHKVKRIIVVDEAKGIFGKSRIGVGTNFLKDMYTKSRSLGCWWILSDQFPTELADFTRASSCLISFQHTVPKDIREISVSMGLTEEQKRMIPQLGRYKVFLKIAEHPTPIQILTYKSKVQGHINDIELNKLTKGKMTDFNSLLKDRQVANKVIVTAIRRIEDDEPKEVVKVTQPVKSHPLYESERFLRFILENPGMKVTEIYMALCLSGRKGGILKNKAIDNGLLIEEIRHLGGQGRPSKELKLTEKGMRYINEK